MCSPATHFHSRSRFVSILGSPEGAADSETRGRVRRVRSQSPPAGKRRRMRKQGTFRIIANSNCRPPSTHITLLQSQNASPRGERSFSHLWIRLRTRVYGFTPAALYSPQCRLARRRLQSEYSRLSRMHNRGICLCLCPKLLRDTLHLARWSGGTRYQVSLAPDSSCLYKASINIKKIIHQKSNSSASVDNPVRPMSSRFEHH